MVTYIIFHILCIGFVIGVGLEEEQIKKCAPLTYFDYLGIITFAPFYASVFIGAFICHLGNKE